jgi:hypothetical protein
VVDFSNIVWPGVALAIGIVFIFVFKEQISDLITRLREIPTPWGPAKLAVSQRRLEKAKPNADKVIADLPDKSHRSETITQRELVSLAPRDVVLVAWGRMKQQLIDSVSTKGLAPDNTESVVNMLANLSRAVSIPEEVNDLIVFLDRLGEDLAQRTAELPEMAAATDYKDYVDLVMTWLHLYVLDSRGDVSSDDREGEAPPPSGHRETLVSSSFPEPSVGAPAAVLLGLSGPFNGKRFAIAQRQVRIGSERDNDLQISGDEFVSGHNSIVRYDDGLLLIEDSGSTNGTFLNWNRLEPGVSHSLKIGDQIKMGESLLEVRSG